MWRYFHRRGGRRALTGAGAGHHTAISEPISALLGPSLTPLTATQVYARDYFGTCQDLADDQFVCRNLALTLTLRAEQCSSVEHLNRNNTRIFNKHFINVKELLNTIETPLETSRVMTSPARRAGRATRDFGRGLKPRTQHSLQCTQISVGGDLKARHTCQT